MNITPSNSNGSYPLFQREIIAGSILSDSQIVKEYVIKIKRLIEDKWHSQIILKEIIEALHYREFEPHFINLIKLMFKNDNFSYQLLMPQIAPFYLFQFYYYKILAERKTSSIDLSKIKTTNLILQAAIYKVLGNYRGVAEIGQLLKQSPKKDEVVLSANLRAEAYLFLGRFQDGCELLHEFESQNFLVDYEVYFFLLLLILQVKEEKKWNFQIKKIQALFQEDSIIKSHFLNPEISILERKQVFLKEYSPIYYLAYLLILEKTDHREASQLALDKFKNTQLNLYLFISMRSFPEEEVKKLHDLLNENILSNLDIYSFLHFTMPFLNKLKNKVKIYNLRLIITLLIKCFLAASKLYPVDKEIYSNMEMLNSYIKSVTKGRLSLESLNLIVVEGFEIKGSFDKLAYQKSLDSLFGILIGLEGPYNSTPAFNKKEQVLEDNHLALAFKAILYRHNNKKLIPTDIISLIKLIKADPHFSAAYHILFEIISKNANFDSTISSFIQKLPQVKETYYHIIKIFAFRNNHLKVIYFCKLFLTINDTSALNGEMLFYISEFYALSLAGLQNSDELRFAQIHSFNKEIGHFIRIQLCLQRNDTHNVLKLIQAYKEKYPETLEKSPRLLSLFSSTEAIAFFLSGNPTQAFQMLQKGDGTLIQKLNYFGIVSAAFGDIPKAKQFGRGLHQKEVISFFEVLYKSPHNKRKIALIFRKRLEKKPFLYSVGYVYFLVQAQLPESLKEFFAVSNYNNIAFYNLLVNAFLALNQPIEASQVFVKGLKNCKQKVSLFQNACELAHKFKSHFPKDKYLAFRNFLFSFEDGFPEENFSKTQIQQVLKPFLDLVDDQIEKATCPTSPESEQILQTLSHLSLSQIQSFLLTEKVQDLLNFPFGAEQKPVDKMVSPKDEILIEGNIAQKRKSPEKTTLDKYIPAKKKIKRSDVDYEIVPFVDVIQGNFLLREYFETRQASPFPTIICDSESLEEFVLFELLLNGKKPILYFCNTSHEKKMKALQNKLLEKKIVILEMQFNRLKKAFARNFLKEAEKNAVKLIYILEKIIADEKENKPFKKMRKFLFLLCKQHKILNFERLNLKGFKNEFLMTPSFEQIKIGLGHSTGAIYIVDSTITLPRQEFSALFYPPKMIIGQFEKKPLSIISNQFPNSLSLLDYFYEEDGAFQELKNKLFFAINENNSESLFACFLPWIQFLLPLRDALMSELDESCAFYDILFNLKSATVDHDTLAILYKSFLKDFSLENTFFETILNESDIKEEFVNLLEPYFPKPKPEINHFRAPITQLKPRLGDWVEYKEFSDPPLTLIDPTKTWNATSPQYEGLDTSQNEILFYESKKKFFDTKNTHFMMSRHQANDPDSMFDKSILQEFSKLILELKSQVFKNITFVLKEKENLFNEAKQKGVDIEILKEKKQYITDLLCESLQYVQSNEESNIIKLFIHSFYNDFYPELAEATKSTNGLYKKDALPNFYDFFLSTLKEKIMLEKLISNSIEGLLKEFSCFLTLAKEVITKEKYENFEVFFKKN